MKTATENNGPEAQNQLGYLTRSLYELEQFENLLAASTLACQEDPESEVLREIKNRVMYKTSYELISQKFDDALPVVEAYFDEKGRTYLAFGLSNSTHTHPEHDKWSEWLLKQPNPEHFENFFRKWASTEPASAGEWVSKLPKDENKEKAVKAYAEQAALIDPDAAKKWVRAHSHPEHTEELIQIIKKQAKVKATRQ